MNELKDMSKFKCVSDKHLLEEYLDEVIQNIFKTGIYSGVDSDEVEKEILRRMINE